MSENISLREKYLPNKKVMLKPLPKGNSMIGNDSSHKGYFMWDGTSVNIPLPKVKETGRLIDIFESQEEREFFAKELGVPVERLNVNNKQSIFNEDDFIVKVRKDENLMKTGIVLDLSNVVENIHYRILTKCSSLVSPSWNERNEKPGEYRFVLVDKDEAKADASELMKKKARAWGILNKLNKSKEDLYSFLYIYNLENKVTGILPEDCLKEEYFTMLAEIVEKSPDSVINLDKDADFQEKILIQRAIKEGFIEYSAKHNSFSIYSKDGDFKVLGNSLKKVVAFYKDDINSEERLLLEAKLKNK